MKRTTTDILEKVESLKNMLVARATGLSTGSDYPQLRLELLHHPLTKGRLPRFVATCRTLDEFWGFIKPKFGTYHERREFIREAFDPLLTQLEQTATTPSDEVHDQILRKVDSLHVQDAWSKALERRAHDPDGSITAARTLLEAVCKHILDELKVPYEDKIDLPKLYGLVAQGLNLSPSQHTQQVFKQILGGCQTVVEGLGALRNKLGDAHGLGKGGVRPAPRHAELAVNLAGTMATFLLSTWEAHRPKGNAP